MTVSSIAMTFPFARRWPLAWFAFAAALLAAPQIFSADAQVSVLSQMLTIMVFALSYNMLLGQGGMLSLGHAVYSGLGAYATAHWMNALGGDALQIPVPLLPLVGGIAGAFFGVVFGYFTTRRGGTVFAMITLALGELVHAAAVMFPGVFGGEAGITVNRTAGSPFLGLTFGSQLQVYYLIAVWLFGCAVAMYAFTQTPLGQMVQAVRDNPERVEFVGYDPRRVRFLAVIGAGFFAGVSGALATLNFEIVGAESVSVGRSGEALLYAIIGGTASFAGPILGTIAGVLLTVKLSDYTAAWQFYLGLFFVLFVVFAPGGLAGLLESAWRLVRAAPPAEVFRAFGRRLAGTVVLAVGGVILVEATYVRAIADRASVNALARMTLAYPSATAGIALVLFAVGLMLWRAEATPQPSSTREETQ